MEIFAYAVLMLVGSLLVATDYTLYKDYINGHTLVLGKSTLLFAILLTIAYYLSLVILIF